MVSITGIIMNVLMLILITIVILYGVGVNRDLQNCLSNESDNCFTMICPCDEKELGPCNGLAYRDGDRPDTFYCSGSSTLVGSNGRPV